MQLLGLSTAELETALQAMGEPAYRGRQLSQWIYRHGAASFDDMRNLGRNLQQRLATEHSLDFPTVAESYLSQDGSNKLLLELADGERVETVHLPYPDRTSVCVSSQAGCAMACAFCATGLGGFRRNLTAAEIIAQPLLAIRNEDAARATHIVFMGMGEPLLNLSNVLRSIYLMHDEMGIPMRHITVSTVGILNGIQRLAAEKLQLTLAVSLHAPEDELRHRLIPTSLKTRVADIIGAAKDYVDKTGRRVTFEYVLLGGVNDHAAHARKLARLCHGWPSHVNLIPWNAVPDATLEESVFRSPSVADIRNFATILEQAGVSVTQRVQRGADVAAACGQLRAIHKIPQPITVTS